MVKSGAFPFSLNSCCCCVYLHSDSRQWPRASKFAVVTRSFRKYRVQLAVDVNGGKRDFTFFRNDLVRQRRLVVSAVEGRQPEQIGDDETFSVEGPLGSSPRFKTGGLQKRIVFGLGIGLSAAGIVMAGGWIYTITLAAAVFVGAREYFDMVGSRRIASGMAPPRFVSRACSVICCLMPILTLYYGNIDVSVTFGAFFVAAALILQRRSPRFAQLSSTMFGLFYCGYLPCFWVKLRCGLSAPALNTRSAASWPILLGGPTLWTVGLVATLVSISNVIAADTFAFFGGKVFGRTPLTALSPKKTWEGVLFGLGGCIATSVLLSRILCWPTSALSSVAFGFLTFLGSLFGDLTESLIKRDAGVKDSGSLIPGHGGVLDRTDSYIFTGALAYAFVKTFLPLYGV